jgi:hypothetical protein
MTGICLYMKDEGRGLRASLGILFSRHLKFMTLPPLNSWNGQSLSTKDISSISLHTYHPTHLLGEAMHLIPLYGGKGEEYPTHFAVVCLPRRSNMDSPPTVVMDTQSPALSSGTYDTSRIPLKMDRGGPPPQWTERETENAVLGANTNKKPAQKICSKTSNTSPSCQSFDESVVLGSNASGSLLAIDNEDISIATVATEVLDMSGRWARRSPLDISIATQENEVSEMSGNWLRGSSAHSIASSTASSVSSPLVGLSFLSTEDSTGNATPSIRRTLLPPRSRRHSFETPRLRYLGSDETHHSDNQTHLVVGRH